MITGTCSSIASRANSGLLKSSDAKNSSKSLSTRVRIPPCASANSAVVTITHPRTRPQQPQPHGAGLRPPNRQQRPTTCCAASQPQHAQPGLGTTPTAPDQHSCPPTPEPNQ